MGEIVTFYSYKGGVGRTMALANVATMLSKWGYRTLMVDWDLEAPGLEFYFREQLRDKHKIEDVIQQQGVIEIIGHQVVDNPSANRNISWKNLVLEIAIFPGSTPLHLLTAGRRDESYFKRIKDLEIQTLYEEMDGGVFIESLRNDWKRAYDFVLIDSRTGITDIGGICTVQLPDILVLLFTANEQSLMGAVEVGIGAQQARHDLPFDRYSLLSVPIPSKFDSRVEFDISQMWLDRFVREVSPLYANWLTKSTDRRSFLEATKIPYMPYFSFGEKLPVLEQGTTDSTGLGYAYETLAALIANRLSYVEHLPSDRAKFIRLASGAEIPDILESSPQTTTSTPPISKKVYRAERLGNRLVLSSELLNKCRTVLLKCDELASDVSLASIFITSELTNYRNGLPPANSMSERIDRTIDYLLGQSLADRRPVIQLFLSELRNRYQREDVLYHQLSELIQTLEQSLSDISFIGNTVSVPFIISAMTESEARNLFNESIFDDPTVATIEQTRFHRFNQELRQGEASCIYRYGQSREDWRPFADQMSTIYEIASDVVVRINQTRDESNANLLQLEFLSSMFFQGDQEGQLNTWDKLSRSGGVVIIDAISLFYPELLRTLLRAQLTSMSKIAFGVIVPSNKHSVMAHELIEAQIKNWIPRIHLRYDRDLDPLVTIDIDNLSKLRRWQRMAFSQIGEISVTPNPDRLAQFREQVGLESPGRLSGLLYGGQQ